ncbi:MAG: NAD(P)/FAD-dependent oxidoreductase, partial [Thermoanaerobaculia bacterium]
LRPLYGEAWLAVGDAALSFDPLSSQGISTALYCADKAASALGAVLDGDPGALPAYAALLDQIFSGYLQGHRLAYQAETRWADRPFWRRRSPGLSGTSLSSLSAAQPDGGLP